jgi:effector-binding domain-containing protein
MRYDVQVREVAPQLMAAGRGKGTAQNFLKHLFAMLDEVWKFLRANPQIKREHNVFLYWNDAEKNLLDTAEGMPLEAGVQVDAPFAGTEKVVCSATPGGTVATAVHIGPYQKLGAAHSAVRAWCKENNRTLAGPNWEVYGDWNEDPEQLRTDVFYLLK